MRQRLGVVGTRARWQSTVADLREPAFAIAARLDDIPHHTRFNALMLAAAVSAQALGLDPHEELERAVRKIADAEGPFTLHIQALRDFVAGELTHD